MGVIMARPPADEKKRFLEKVSEKDSGCHEWLMYSTDIKRESVLKRLFGQRGYVLSENAFWKTL